MGGDWNSRRATTRTIKLLALSKTALAQKPPGTRTSGIVCAALHEYLISSFIVLVVSDIFLPCMLKNFLYSRRSSEAFIFSACATQIRQLSAECRSSVAIDLPSDQPPAVGSSRSRPRCAVRSRRCRSYAQLSCDSQLPGFVMRWALLLGWYE